MVREETLDRTIAKDETLLRQAGAHLLDCGVSAWSKCRYHGITMNLDPTRTPIPAEPPGDRVALFALPLPPTADAGGAHAKTLGRLPVRRTGCNSSKDPNSKIDR